jgi:pimeloyl-ACP methyl ester carboxylesterase
VGSETRVRGNVLTMDSFTRGGLTFDVLDSGPPDGTPVVLLHGFPQTSSCWDEVTEHLTAQDLRVLAPNQRGYSPGARPKGRRAYRLQELVDDVKALLDAAGLEQAHVVGHDWGAAVAWGFALTYPDRTATLTALSVGHPGAFAKSAVTSRQLLHSWYMGFFQLPGVPELALSRNLEKSLISSGATEQDAKRDAAALSDKDALTAALSWYRAIPFGDPRLLKQKVTVPTLYVWSSGDQFVQRGTAESTAQTVTGPYRFVELEGSHWIPDQQAARAAELIGEQINR